jgi:RNA polymerase sigma-70 factor (ECF subfamily)
MAQGDRQALSSLYRRHAPKLLGLLLSMLGGRAEAEDLLHDVFLEVWRHAPDYAPERGSVRAWLTTRARCRALDRIKSVARRKSVPTEQAPERSAPPALDDQRRLQETLLEMPENQRDVLLLAYFEDLSASEIAVRLQIPVGTVKSRIRAALSTLRGSFGEGAP